MKFIEIKNCSKVYKNGVTDSVIDNYNAIKLDVR